MVASHLLCSHCRPTSILTPNHLLYPMTVTTIPDTSGDALGGTMTGLLTRLAYYTIPHLPDVLMGVIFMPTICLTRALLYSVVPFSNRF